MSDNKPFQAQTAATDLPEGWATATIGEVTRVKVDQSGPSDDEFIYIDIASIDNDRKSITAPRVVPLGDAPSRARQVVHSGDVLVSMTRPNLNAVALVNPDLDRAIASTGFDVLRAVGVTPGWLFLIVRGQPFIDSMTALVQGALYPAVRPRDVRGFQLPFPPFAEQGRIVAKVEALLERLNVAGRRLAKVPAILKRFRQSVLAAACFGQLTTEWRELASDADTSQDEAQSLEKERFRLWCEAMEAKAKSDGRTLTGTSWQRQYVRPKRLDDSELPELPATWRWATFDHFAASFQYGPRFGEREYVTAGGFPTVRTSDMDFRGRITFQDPPHVKIPKKSVDHFALQQDDLLVTRTGATIGKCALYDTSLGPAIASAYLIRYRMPTQMACPRYLLTVFMSPWGQEHLIGGTTAVAQPNVNTRTIAAIPIPVPPVAEQREIVRRVEALLTLADTIEARVRAATVSVGQLPQTILARAFRGELVPTEAELAANEGRSYEPASVLLERIQESRKQQKPAARGHGGKSMAKRTSRQPAKSLMPLDEVLREQGKPLTPERLFALAGFDEDSVDGFYEQLRKLLEEGKVRENRPNRKDVTLEVVRT